MFIFGLEYKKLFTIQTPFDIITIQYERDGSEPKDIWKKPDSHESAKLLIAH